MEGFYYDAEIKYIVEIIKDTLYFAVLESEFNKTIRNTIDTFYFSIDDELLYNNYYYDFGPLNISCLYKYCCKLNGYLKYTQGLKRIIHYTTANPIKRVNAAFLIGCYTIVYMKMQPRDIYRLLLTSGSGFKEYVDASQGIPHFTIRLLDCFHAIQKAVAFNLFNFSDFNAIEYDTYDKLQNGDMNWILPRKFLAFIGPIDTDTLNGHPPDFYIKYFLDHDIKTVIRLNNKMYDASGFTRAGIEHYDLFFPDGTVPSKQILVQFLELSETARSAIAVHCKAGLGRTGSLIGAYIVKHYHMTAREAIAWMRICRPGSVIGQQQGWLEKIESWLWRQGGQYRLHHFGDGDKIPHNEYGIYSKEWPKQRKRLIENQIQRRNYEAQTNNAHSKSKMQNQNNCALPLAENSIRRTVIPIRNQNYIQKRISSAHKDEEYKKAPKLLSKSNKNSFSANSRTKGQFQDDISNIKIKNRHSAYPNKQKEEYSYKELNNNFKHKKCTTTIPSIYAPYESEIHSTSNLEKALPIKIKRRNQSETREYDERIRKHYENDFIQTQGDKLNEIKARRYTEPNSSNEINIKGIKRRPHLSNNANIYNKSSTTPSRREEINRLTLPKRSHFQHYYSTGM